VPPRPPSRLSTAVCAAVAAFLAQLPAHAGDSSEAAVQQARALSEQALRQYELGRFAEAARLYESAYELKPVPALLFNIAQCRRQLGDLQGAAAAYRSFLRGDPDHASAPRARKLLDQVVEEALHHSGAPAQHAAISGVSSPPVPSPAISVSAATAVPSQALSGAAPVAPARKRWPALVAGGTAVALLAVAVAESFAARSATDQLAQLHQQGAVSPSDDARLRADAESKYARARVLYVVSAVTAAAGVGFYFAF
jgi:tetratricopeptide (TPR) repeat protein